MEKKNIVISADGFCPVCGAKFWGVCVHAHTTGNYGEYEVPVGGWLPAWHLRLVAEIKESGNPWGAWRSLRVYPDCGHTLPDGQSMPEPNEYIRTLDQCVDCSRELRDSAEALARWVASQPRPVYLLSAQIVPIRRGERAVVEVQPFSVMEVKNLLSERPLISAVGHAGTAEALSALLGMEIPQQRLEVFLRPGDEAIQFVLAIRQPEGVVLDRKAVEKIGYHLALVRRTE